MATNLVLFCRVYTNQKYTSFSVIYKQNTQFYIVYKIYGFPCTITIAITSKKTINNGNNTLTKIWWFAIANYNFTICNSSGKQQKDERKNKHKFAFNVLIARLYFAVVLCSCSHSCVFFFIFFMQSSCIYTNCSHA